VTRSSYKVEFPDRPDAGGLMNDVCLGGLGFNRRCGLSGNLQIHRAAGVLSAEHSDSGFAYGLFFQYPQQLFPEMDRASIPSCAPCGAKEGCVSEEEEAAKKRAKRPDAMLPQEQDIQVSAVSVAMVVLAIVLCCMLVTASVLLRRRFQQWVPESPESEAALGGSPKSDGSPAGKWGKSPRSQGDTDSIPSETAGHSPLRQLQPSSPSGEMASLRQNRHDPVDDAGCNLPPPSSILGSPDHEGIDVQLDFSQDGHMGGTDSSRPLRNRIRGGTDSPRGVSFDPSIPYPSGVIFPPPSTIFGSQDHDGHVQIDASTGLPRNLSGSSEPDTLDSWQQAQRHWQGYGSYYDPDSADQDGEECIGAPRFHTQVNVDSPSRTISSSGSPTNRGSPTSRGSDEGLDVSRFHMEGTCIAKDRGGGWKAPESPTKGHPSEPRSASPVGVSLGFHFDSDSSAPTSRQNSEEFSSLQEDAFLQIPAQREESLSPRNMPTQLSRVEEEEDAWEEELAHVPMIAEV